MLHNCYLPDWLHRLANGTIGAGVSSLAALAAVEVLGMPLWALWFVLPVAFACTALDPDRFSLVEGCAGDLGDDELQEHNERPDVADWGEAVDA